MTDDAEMTGASAPEVGTATAAAGATSSASRTAAAALGEADAPGSSTSTSTRAATQASARGARKGASGGILPPIPRATSVIIIGMAGSGKSTFAARLANHVGPSARLGAAVSGQGEGKSTRGKERSTADAGARGDDGSAAQGKEGPEGGERPRPYCVNLDPAVAGLGYEPNIDVRDTVDYAKVMKDYHLGPNGGILTALNLFTTKFDQVLGILEQRANEVDEIILDTPGQIEIFTWSASGSIITDALGSAMPTCVAYVIDTPRTTAPATFMSNMLYACSIMYKSKLPFIVVFNKTDIQPHDFALEWMNDFEAFQRDLKSGNATDPVPEIVAQRRQGPGAAASSSSARRAAYDPEAEGSYMNSLMNSMALVLDEFYTNLRAVGVSSTTGEGIDDFLRAVQEARNEYLSDYRPELERIAAEKEACAEKEKKRQLDRLMRDMALSKGEGGGGSRFGDDRWEDDDEEERRKGHSKGLTMEERRRRYELLKRAGRAKGAGGEEDEEDDEIIEPQYEGDGLILEPDPPSDEDEKKEDTAFERMLKANADKPFGIDPNGTGADGTKWPPIA